jgi:hypothetical protein
MATKKKPYEAPKVVVLGSLHELTQQTKTGPHCDVSCFHHGSMTP